MVTMKFKTVSRSILDIASRKEATSNPNPLSKRMMTRATVVKTGPAGPKASTHRPPAAFTPPDSAPIIASGVLRVPVRRIKSYSAATGYVYQYHFEEVRPQQQPAGREGTEDG